jgi:FdhD protein
MLARVMSMNEPAISGQAGAAIRTVRRWRDGRIEQARDLVADEVPVALEYNGAPFAVMMATPCDLEDFAIGFSLSEGIVECAGDISIDSINTWIDGVAVQLRVTAATAAALSARRRNLQGRSGCGICGNESIEAVLQPPALLPQRLRTDAAAIARAMVELRERQPLNAITGATHAAGWARPDGAIALVREDVGRHNALDKLIGALHRAGIDPRDGFVVVTSRASFEMALKAARVGIELLAAISAPTSLAIALAESAGQTLLGFVRDTDHVVYTHAGRLRSPGETDTAP